jgi:hypothetical protein
MRDQPQEHVQPLLSLMSLRSKIQNWNKKLENPEIGLSSR